MSEPGREAGGNFGTAVVVTCVVVVLVIVCCCLCPALYRWLVPDGPFA